MQLQNNNDLRIKLFKRRKKTGQLYHLALADILSSPARSPGILDALKSMASRCCRLLPPEKRCLQLSGVNLSSPMTFFLAFLQMAKTFKESGKVKVFLLEWCNV